MYKIDNNKFILEYKIKDLIIELDKMVVNIPNRERVLKDNITKDSYLLLEYILISNLTNKYNKTFINKVNILCKLSMIDFYLELSYKNKYISYKEMSNMTSYLLEIKKLTYGWLKSEGRF